MNGPIYKIEFRDTEDMLKQLPTTYKYPRFLMNQALLQTDTSVTPIEKFNGTSRNLLYKLSYY